MGTLNVVSFFPHTSVQTENFLFYSRAPDLVAVHSRRSFFHCHCALIAIVSTRPSETNAAVMSARRTHLSRDFMISNERGIVTSFVLPLAASHLDWLLLHSNRGVYRVAGQHKARRTQPFVYI